MFAPGLSEEDHQELQSITEAVSFSRDLINEPLQSLGATDLAERIRTKGTECGFTSEVFSKKKIESLKMGGILAVNRGSLDPPSFSILEWKPKKPINERPIVLVGKGVVYDTGGLSLKPTPGSMDSMKSDMSGAAAVAGAFVLASRQKLPVHLIGLIPATDNRPGSMPTRQNIIDMYDGSTVEVLNTNRRKDAARRCAELCQEIVELVIDLATHGFGSHSHRNQGLVAMGMQRRRKWMPWWRAEIKYTNAWRYFIWDDYKDMSFAVPIEDIGGRERAPLPGKFRAYRLSIHPRLLDLPSFRPRTATGQGGQCRGSSVVSVPEGAEMTGNENQIAAISMGDLNGIEQEVILKSLSDDRIWK